MKKEIRNYCTTCERRWTTEGEVSSSVVHASYSHKHCAACVMPKEPEFENLSEALVMCYKKDLEIPLEYRAWIEENTPLPYCADAFEAERIIDIILNLDERMF